MVLATLMQIRKRWINVVCVLAVNHASEIGSLTSLCIQCAQLQLCLQKMVVHVLFCILASSVWYIHGNSVSKPARRRLLRRSYHWCTFVSVWNEQNIRFVETSRIASLSDHLIAAAFFIFLSGSEVILILQIQ